MVSHFDFSRERGKESGRKKGGGGEESNEFYVSHCQWPRRPSYIRRDDVIKQKPPKCARPTEPLRWPHVARLSLIFHHTNNQHTATAMRCDPMTKFTQFYLFNFECIFGNFLSHTLYGHMVDGDFANALAHTHTHSHIAISRATVDHFLSGLRWRHCCNHGATAMKIFQFSL